MHIMVEMLLVKRLNRIANCTSSENKASDRLGIPLTTIVRIIRDVKIMTSTVMIIDENSNSENVENLFFIISSEFRIRSFARSV